MKQSLIMGILNVTPDSFSDGGQYLAVDEALKQALKMIEDGAKIIDIGGESSGPGSKDVSVEEELKRVIPVIRAIREFDKNVTISIDTCKSQVAKEAILAGANMVNDVSALRFDEQNMLKVLNEFNVPIVIMYSKDLGPRTTAFAQEYDNVVGTIKTFLQKRIEFLVANGVDKSRIIVDPGMGGFVSSVAKYSFEIIDRLAELKTLGCPILVGTSRKSFLGGDVKDRLEASIKTAKECVENGASIVRVHDVKQTVQALL